MLNESFERGIAQNLPYWYYDFFINKQLYFFLTNVKHRLQYKNKENKQQRQ